MNGVHDLGGMHGFGSIPNDDAAFHSDWEREVFAMTKILLANNTFTLPEHRYAETRMEPGDYLSAKYFERWMEACLILLFDKNVIDRENFEERKSEFKQKNRSIDKKHDSQLVSLMEESFREDMLSGQPAENPKFGIGDTVVVQNMHPEGHTRCPRFVRRAVGTIKDIRGAFPLADKLVEGEEMVEPCYLVRFSLSELWGEDHPDDDYLSIDLWESYIEDFNSSIE